MLIWSNPGGVSWAPHPEVLGASQVLVPRGPPRGSRGEPPAGPGQNHGCVSVEYIEPPYTHPITVYHYRTHIPHTHSITHRPVPILEPYTHSRTQRPLSIPEHICSTILEPIDLYPFWNPQTCIYSRTYMFNHSRTHRPVPILEPTDLYLFQNLYVQPF